jgi:YidC/Oxa1 family membrane protein insertase
VDQALDNDLAVNITKAIERVGELKGMGLDYGWGPSASFQWLLEHLYIDGGLGWGGAIIAATIVLRLVLFPFQLKASDSMARMAAITPLTKETQEELKVAIAERDRDAIHMARQKQRRIYKEFNVGPFKAMMPLLGQGVIGFGAFRCLRGMATLPVPGLAENGWFWFENLTIADPYYLLPAVTGSIMYLVIKVRLGY